MKGPHFLWRFHDSSESTGSSRRVWRTDWAGDQFEVLAAAEFIQFERFCLRFGMSIHRHRGDD